MIKLKHTVDCEHDAISNYKNVIELYDVMRNTQNQEVESQKIFVWTGFGSQISDESFENSNWQRNFVGLFSDQEMWPWKFKFAKSEADQFGNKNLLKALGHPSKNVIASLRIRNFESDDSFQGSPGWFDEIIPYLNDEYNESMVLIDHIIYSLHAAREAGINLFLEKISLIVSNDPNNSITLTPNLHRDGAYGHLESATVSFYSKRITPNSSTLFFPDFDFDAASHLKPITAEKLNNQFPNTLAYSLASGNLAIFSGKLGNDGSKSDARGALHMSPEGFFSTRRLVLLFRSEISTYRYNINDIQQID
jgi:hypothetical protein